MESSTCVFCKQEDSNMFAKLNIEMVGPLGSEQVTPDNVFASSTIKTTYQLAEISVPCCLHCQETIKTIDRSLRIAKLSYRIIGPIVGFMFTVMILGPILETHRIPDPLSYIVIFGPMILVYLLFRFLIITLFRIRANRHYESLGTKAFESTCLQFYNEIQAHAQQLSNLGYFVSYASLPRFLHATVKKNIPVEIEKKYFNSTVKDERAAIAITLERIMLDRFHKRSEKND